MLIQGPRMITSQHGRIVSRIKLSRASSICGALPSSCNILYQTHSTCAAATDDDVVEEDVAVHVSHKTSIRRMNAIKQDMPRLQKLRQRLETDPPLPSILQAAASSSSSSSRQQQPDTKDDDKDSSSPFIVQPKSREKINKLLFKAKQQQLSFQNDEDSTKNRWLLTDRYNRHHSYLRISLSERCNLRCQYCMPPEGVPLQKQDKLLTDEEILELVDLFVEAGVKKIRLTGGEPLLRPSLATLLNSISTKHPHLTSLGITTNGLTLSKQLPDLLSSGLTHVNISLDTLHSDKFVHITRRNGLERVLKAIDDTVDAYQQQLGGRSMQGKVKVNCVVMKGFNDNELYDFVNLTKNKPVDVRFIEWMPFAQNGWNNDKFVSYKDMLTLLQEQHEEHLSGNDSSGVNNENGIDTSIFKRETDGANDTTKWYSLQPSSVGRVGFITSMSQHFCNTCNRLRITADGNLKVCLFGSDEVSLRDALRMKKENENELSEEDLRLLVHMAVRGKKAVLGGHGSSQGIKDADDNRPMTLIGG